MVAKELQALNHACTSTCKYRYRLLDWKKSLGNHKSLRDSQWYTDDRP